MKNKLVLLSLCILSVGCAKPPNVVEAQLAQPQHLEVENEYPVLLAEKSTVFEAGWDYKNRVQNIHTASANFDNLVVQPGQTVSFNDLVGKRIPSRGYRVSKAIVGGKMTKELGGGVCQVSGTLFNTLQNIGGINIVEHHYHSRKSSYLELGEDSTVDYGKKDLKFQNNLGFAVLIKRNIEALNDGRSKKKERITFSVYGKEPNPLEVNIVTETLYRKKSTTNTVVSKDPNQKRKILVEAAADGFHVRKTTTTTRKDTGEVVSTVVEKISYNAVDGLVIVPMEKK